MAPEQFSLLLEKFLAEELNPDELASFLISAKDAANHKMLYDAVGEKLTGKVYTGLSDKTDMDKMFQQMLAKVEKHSGEDAAIVEMPVRKRFFILSRIAAASAILIILLGNLYFLLPGKKELQIANTTVEQRFKNDVNPGHQGAILTLSNGQQVILDSTNNGAIANQGNANIAKENNQLIYSKESITSEVVYNTMTTPRGRQYSLVLSDGTKVWLNAASSITYPTVFMNGERKVSIKGEAYFEVAHNATMPFVVENGSTSVRVLGTHFNVNSYEDENSINITLLEGSVNVLNNSVNRIIKPAEQAQVMQNGNIQVTNKIDLEEVMAWKNERFVFESAPIKAIMRQVARWYNVDVVYKSDIPYFFVADMSRNLPVSELLKLLELTGGVHFKIEGNTITVMK